MTLLSGTATFKEPFSEPVTSDSSAVEEKLVSVSVPPCKEVEGGESASDPSRCGFSAAETGVENCKASPESVEGSPVSQNESVELRGCVSVVSPPSSRLANGSPDESEKENGGNASQRERFRRYWEYADKYFGPTVAGMMLKPDVEPVFAALERQEVLSCIKEELDGRVVDVWLELGAGIGRFTPHLFPYTRKLVAVDLIETYIKENQSKHSMSSRPEDEFLCMDALHLSYPAQSIDVVFWNWLLMYLSDAEVVAFICRAAIWLKPGGYIFCRESCGKPSNAAKRGWALEGNPTCYRVGSFYTQLFTKTVPSLTGVEFCVVFHERPIHVYEEVMQSMGQLAWFLRKL